MSQGPPIDLERSAPEGDISLGRELRRAREVRGISVQQIAQETKINERYIHALENDRLDLLPGQPYTGNFVRSIARCIGADEEELVDYLNYHLRIQQPERRDEARSSGRDRHRPGLPLVLGVGAILLIVLLTLALRGGDEDKKPSREEPRTVAASAPVRTETAPEAPAPAAATEASGPVASAPRPAPVLGALAPPPAASAATASAPAGASAPGASAPAAASAAEGPAPTVRLVFREKSWIEIQQEGDDKPLLGIRQVGDELSWTLDRPLRMQINNAGGVEMFIDGQPAKPLGGPRETRSLVLDRKNWKTYFR